METQDTPGKKKSRRRFWHWFVPAVSVLFALLVMRSCAADWTNVTTASMNPTVLEGDRVLVNKLAYDLKVPFTQARLARWGGHRRGDIVLFDSPDDGTRLVKRIVALPGDTIEVRNDRITLNGRPLTYELPRPTSSARTPVVGTESVDGRTHPIQITPVVSAMRSFGPLVVPPDRYFVMGDNRDNSSDSRYFGAVEAGRIVGKVTRVVYSKDPARDSASRWDRFLTSLP